MAKAEAVKVQELDPAAKMLASKRALIRRLKRELVDIGFEYQRQVAATEFRIRQANTLIAALEKGTLKP